MKVIAINRLGGVKVPIDVDPQTGRASGPICKLFGCISTNNSLYFGTRLGSCR